MGFHTPSQKTWQIEETSEIGSVIVFVLLLAFWLDAQYFYLWMIQLKGFSIYKLPTFTMDVWFWIELFVFNDYTSSIKPSKYEEYIYIFNTLNVREEQNTKLGKLHLLFYFSQAYIEYNNQLLIFSWLSCFCLFIISMYDSMAKNYLGTIRHVSLLYQK